MFSLFAMSDCQALFVEALRNTVRSSRGKRLRNGLGEAQRSQRPRNGRAKPKKFRNGLGKAKEAEIVWGQPRLRNCRKKLELLWEWSGRSPKKAQCWSGRAQNGSGMVWEKPKIRIGLGLVRSPKIDMVWEKPNFPLQGGVRVLSMGGLRI